MKADSGVLPHGWELAPARSRLSYQREMRDPRDLGSERVFHYSIPSLQETGDGREELARSISSAKIVLRGGEILVSKLNPRKGLVVESQSHQVPTVCSSEFVPFLATGGNPRFVFYAFQSHRVRSMLAGAARSATRSHQRCEAQDITRASLPWPPANEQRAIVRFLDEETAKIDVLIKRNRRLLILIDEHRRRLVMEAVTKGIRENAELADSRIPWIGHVPRAWTIRRIKQVARLASGHTPSRSHPEYWLDAEIPWFQLTDIWRFRDDSEESISETAELISEVGLRNSAAELLPAGTVALSRTASVGFSAILGVDMATTQDFANWVPGPLVNSAYLLYVLRAMRPELERLRFGSTHKTIYMPDIGQLVMPLPPLDEQQEIVSHIRAESRRLLQTRGRVQEVVEKLREYRAALITAAVTGQVDVSGAA